MSPGRCGPRPGCEGCDLGHQLRPAQERGGAAQNGICHIIHIYICDDDDDDDDVDDFTWFPNYCM